MRFYVKNNELKISILIVNNMNSIYLGKHSQKGWGCASSHPVFLGLSFWVIWPLSSKRQKKVSLKTLVEGAKVPQPIFKEVWFFA